MRYAARSYVALARITKKEERRRRRQSKNVLASKYSRPFETLLYWWRRFEQQKPHLVSHRGRGRGRDCFRLLHNTQ